MRVDRHLTRVSVVAEHEKPGAIATHFDGFWNYLWRADTLDDHVCAIAARQLTHALDALLGRRQLLDVQTLGGAKPPRGFQPLLRATDHNYPTCPMVKRHGQRGQANWARSLYHNHVAPIQPHAFDAVDSGDQSAS